MLRSASNGGRPRSTRGREVVCLFGTALLEQQEDVLGAVASSFISSIFEALQLFEMSGEETGGKEEKAANQGQQPISSSLFP